MGVSELVNIHRRKFGIHLYSKNIFSRNYINNYVVLLAIPFRSFGSQILRSLLLFVRFRIYCIDLYFDRRNLRRCFEEERSRPLHESFMDRNFVRCLLLTEPPFVWYVQKYHLNLS